MIESDQAEERLARIDRVLRQLQRQRVSFNAIATKLINDAVHATSSLATDPVRPAEPFTAADTRITVPARVEQKNNRRVAWRNRGTG